MLLGSYPKYFVIQAFKIKMIMVPWIILHSIMNRDAFTRPFCHCTGFKESLIEQVYVKTKAIHSMCVVITDFVSLETL